MELRKDVIVPTALVNDNFQGFLEAWVYQEGVTWMEKTVATPFWTGIVLFSLRKRDQERKAQKVHKLHDAMYAATTRVAWKGQLFSAPMDWNAVVQQLQTLENTESLVALPVLGAVLNARVRVAIASGLVDLKIRGCGN